MYINGKMFYDLKMAWRIVRRRPRVAVTTVVALALGIGVATAVFSLFYSVVLRPLPFAKQDRLVVLYEQRRNYRNKSDRREASPATFLDWRRASQSFEMMGAAKLESHVVSLADEKENVHTGNVTEAFLSILEVRPFLGRSFGPEDFRVGSPPVLLVSYEFWNSALGSDPDAVGRVLTLESGLRTVVGVLPRGFTIPGGFGSPAIWLPFSSDGPAASDRRSRLSIVLARLRLGVTLEEVRSEMDVVARRLEHQYRTLSGWGVQILRWREDLVRDVHTKLVILLGIGAFVVLIACANVTNLLLAQAGTRFREMAIRSALGARRIRIGRQVLVESIAVSLAGAIVGVVLASWTLGALSPPLFVGMPRTDEIGLHLPVLAFAFVLAVLAGAACGIAPTFVAIKVKPSVWLQEAGSGSKGRSASLASAIIVIAETAAVLVLVIGAGLMIESYRHLAGVNPGFRSADVLTATVSPGKEYQPAQKTALVDQIVTRVAAMPGVLSTGVIDAVPLMRIRNYFEFEIGDHSVAPGEHTQIAAIREVTPGYFQTLQIPLLAGRDFTDRDRADAPAVVILSDELRRRCWPTEDPIGRNINYSWGDEQRTAEVVGIADDVRQWSLKADYEPHLYVPYAQLSLPGQFVLVVRSGIDVEALAPALRAEILRIDGRLPPPTIRTMESYLDTELAETRYYTKLLGTFSLLALVLGAVGIYGVFSYMVTQQTREIAIRVALGAPRGSVLMLVLRRALILVATGTFFGIAGAMALTRFQADLLYGVTPRDPMTFALVSFAVLGIALFSAYFPARRATGLDVMSALRS